MTPQLARQQADRVALADLGRAAIRARDGRGTWRAARACEAALVRNGASIQMAERCAAAMRAVADVVRSAARRDPGAQRDAS